jgi:hypothetical protein
MKHSTHCVEIPTRELVALGQALSIAIPQSLTDLVGHLPALPAAKTATTTLSGAGAPTSATTIAFVTPVVIQPGDVILIDTELMLVQAVRDPVAPVGSQQSVQVVRGYGGSTVAAHSSGAAVSFATLTATQIVKDRLNMEIGKRSAQSSAYVWPFQATPPNFAQKPNQIGGASAIATTAEQTGVVIPAAPGGGNPDPAPPSSAPVVTASEE